MCPRTRNVPDTTKKKKQRGQKMSEQDLFQIEQILLQREQKIFANEIFSKLNKKS